MNAVAGGVLWALVAGTAVAAFVAALVGVAVWFARPAASTCCMLWLVPFVTCVVAPLAIVGAMTTRWIETPASARAEPPARFPSPAGGLVSSAVRTADTAFALRPLAAATKSLLVPPSMPTDVALALGGVWSAGALIGIVTLIASIARVRGLKERSLPLAGALADDLPWLTDSPGREIYVRLSYEIETPIAIGFGRPVILIPHEMAAAPTGLRAIESLVMHEYAHLVRYDDWTNCIERVAERVLWFNPLLWFLGRRIELEREAAADDAVVRRTHDATAYASTLWRMAREMRMPQDSAVAPGAIHRRAQVSVRIERLVQAPRRPAVIIGSAIVAIAASCVCAAAGVAPPFAAQDSSGSIVAQNSASARVAAISRTQVRPAVDRAAGSRNAARRLMPPVVSALHLPETPKVVAQNNAAGAAASPSPQRSTIHKMNGARRARRQFEKGCIDCNLSGVDLHGQDLRGARFRNANMQGADLHDADLRGADLTNVNLQGADLDGADLRRARLLDTDLQGASTRRARMAGATLINTSLP